MTNARQHKLEIYRKFTDFIECNYSTFKNEKIIKCSYLSDVSVLNNIIGRMEVYLVDKVDVDNFDLMSEWFERELDDRDYSMSMLEDFYNNYIDEKSTSQEENN